MRFLFVVCVLVSAISSGPAAAAVPAPQPAAQALSAADAAAARKALVTLGEAFGVQQPAPVTPPAEGGHKTVGDVADKALDLVGKAVASVSSTVEKVAPHIWRIMIRQQYADALGDLLLPWGLAGLALAFFFTMKKQWPKPAHDSDVEVPHLLVAQVFPAIVGIVFAVWGVRELAFSIKILINPEYYAVRDLIAMLLRQST